MALLRGVGRGSLTPQVLEMLSDRCVRDEAWGVELLRAQGFRRLNLYHLGCVDAHQGSLAVVVELSDNDYSGTQHVGVEFIALAKLTLDGVPCQAGRALQGWLTLVAVEGEDLPLN